MRSKDCRHWARTILDQKLPENQGTCESPKWQKGYGETQTEKSDFIHIENDEGWGMYCGPDFGCVHFEPITSQTDY